MPPGWLFGSCKDKEGLFPANYAEKVPENKGDKGDYMELKPASSSGATQSSSGVGSSVSSIIAALNSQKELPIAMPVVSADDVFQAKETSQTPAIVRARRKL